MSTTINGLRSNVSRDELIDETIALVEGHKEKDGLVWNQTTWVQPVDCGTAYCVAGGVAITAGYVLSDTELNRYGSFGNNEEWRRPRGKITHHVSTLAKKLLGLDYFEAEWLFYVYRAQPDVLAGLRKLKDGGRINELPAFRTYIEENYGEPSLGHAIPAIDGWEYYQEALAALEAKVIANLRAQPMVRET